MSYNVSIKRPDTELVYMHFKRPNNNFCATPFQQMSHRHQQVCGLCIIIIEIIMEIIYHENVILTFSAEMTS